MTAPARAKTDIGRSSFVSWFTFVAGVPAGVGVLYLIEYGPWQNETVQHEIARALQGLIANNEQVAVRSSALDEDGAAHSLAGQLDSFAYELHSFLMLGHAPGAARAPDGEPGAGTAPAAEGGTKLRRVDTAAA